MIGRRSAPGCRLLLASCLLVVGVAPAAGQRAQAPPAADSAVAPRVNSEAVETFRSALALENRGLYDLAEAQWRSLIERFSADPLAGQARHFRGLCLFQLGRYAEAQQQFERVIADCPQIDADLLEQSYVNLGLAQFNIGRAASGNPRNQALDAAIATFTAQLKRFPDGKQSPTARLYRAEARYAKSEVVQAARGYRAFVQRYADHSLRPQALYGLGVAEQDSQHPAEAVESFRQFLNEFPQHDLTADVHLRCGEALVSLGRAGEAEPHFAAAAAAADFADAADALARQAECRVESKDYGAAARLYAGLVERLGDSPLVVESTVAAGKCYCLAGDAPQAITWLRRGQGLAGDDAELSAEAAHWLVQALITDGQALAAIDTADTALRSNPPQHWLVRLRLDRTEALWELADRRRESAVAYAAIAHEFSDDALASHAAYMAAYTALEVGEYSAALAHAAWFLESYPDSNLVADVRHVVAEANLQLGNYDKAAPEFERLLTDFPQHEAVDRWHVRRALCHSLMRQHEEVIQTLEPRWDQLADEALQAEAGLLLGRALLAADEPKQAVKVLATAAALPRWEQADEVLLTLAQAEHASGKTTAGIATLGRLIHELPDSRWLDRAYYHRGEYHAVAGDHDAAIGDFTVVMTRWPDSALAPQALLSRARLEYRRTSFAAAEATLTRFLARYGRHPLAVQAHLLRATVRHDVGNYAGGIADVRSLLALSPSPSERFDALYVRGLCEAGLTRPSDAAATFESIWREYPQHSSVDRVLYELGKAYQQLHDADRAAAAYRRLAKNHPDSLLAAESWYRVGKWHYERSEFADAALSFETGEARATDDALRENAAHMSGWARYSQRQFAEAERAFDRQLVQFPDGTLAGDAAVMLAECRFGRKDYAGALDAYSTALAQRTAREELVALGLLHAGQAAAQIKRWEQSLALLNQCLEDHPECQWIDQVRYERGWALYHLKRHAEARREFEAVAGTSTEALAARARFMVGEIQFANKHYDEAVRTFFQVAYGFGGADAPQAVRAWQAEAMFEAARCLEKMRRLDAARKLYVELVERFPESRKAAHARNSLSEIRTR